MNRRLLSMVNLPGFPFRAAMTADLRPFAAKAGARWGAFVGFRMGPRYFGVTGLAPGASKR